MRNLSPYLIVLLLVLFSCESDDNNTINKTPPLTITVYSAADWSASEPSIPGCEGATVTISGSGYNKSGSTNAMGQIVFSDLFPGTYTIDVTKGELSNIVYKDPLTGLGFVPIGIFNSNKDITDYSISGGHLIQPNAVPGDLKLLDYNNDGVIDDYDRTAEYSYSFTPYVDANEDGRITADDQVNGSYEFLEKETTTIYIGN